MGRGPSYPSTDLEGAIAYTRKVYDYVKRGSAAVDAVVKDGLKLSPTSSGSQKTIAALRSFGMIEDAPASNGKAIKLSTRAIRILLDDQDSTERNEELKKAALSPKWYEYCWSKWGKDMPPAMRSNLLIEHGFIESTIDGFLSDYRKSIAFAGLLDDVILPKEGQGKDESKDRFKIGDWVQWETQGCLRLPKASRIVAFVDDDGKYATVEGYENNPIAVAELIQAEAPKESEKPFTPQNIFIPAIKPSGQIHPVVREESKMQTDVIAIGGNSIILQIQWPTEITQEAYDDLDDYLALLLKRAKRAIKVASDAPNSTPTPHYTATTEGVS
jgi:hypothetical protein